MRAESLFAGGGEMGALMRSYDWSKTSLGSTECWSQSLKTAVRIMLTSRQPMFVWWGEELINLYNDAYKAIVGGKHPQALGQPASQVWQEIWGQVGPRAESATIKNEGTYDEALLLIMERNGYPEETYYTFSYSPVPDDGGNTGGIICANTDDTQRIIGERQLVLLRELAARTADARTFDQACKLSASCLETNPYDLPFAAIYLVEPEQQCISLAGTSGIARNHPAVPAIVALDTDSVWPFAEAIETHQACLVSNLEATFSSLPTGAWQRSPHQAVVVPIAPSGQTGRAGILVVGLNPFRLFDDNYRRFIDLVAAQISASIANANAYEEERKRAEALAQIDRAKTAFFSNVSHEFRTPLTLMLSPLEDTLANVNGELAPPQRETLELVHRNGLRLLKLVNSLLDFSRIEAGRIQAVYEPTDLASFTAELASMFRSATERAGLHLAIDCPPLPQPVYVDRDMWEKIVLNLLSNAFKFTFEGEIALGLHLVGDRVELIVRDTGVGISAAELPHLFERFYRVSGTRSRTYEGSGIGLALVQELVKLHGGNVSVSSALEQGTTFTVTMPLGSAHLQRDRIQANRTLQSTALGAAPFVEEAERWLPKEENGGTRGGRDLGSVAGEFTLSPRLSPLSSNARILLVDDNADMRDYVKRLLSQYYAVEAVEDGIAALEAIGQQIPDLILSDVMMPRLDGFELLRELRTAPQTQELPIILLSARAGEESRVEGLEAGADDYLIKPFSARELLARVEANLKLARLRQAAAKQERVLRVEAQKAKAELESVLSGISDQFLVLDRQWRYTYVNERVVEITGKQREELLGKSIWELFPETVGTQFYTELHRAMTEQTPVQFEYFYSPWQRWFENRVYPAENGVTIFSAEITARKQAEASLCQSEERFRLATRAVDALVFDWDLLADSVYRSQKLFSLVGVRLEDAPPSSNWWRDRIHPDDLARLPQMLDLLASDNNLYNTEYRVRHEDGNWVDVWERGCLVRDEHGQVVRIVGSTADITSRKQAETALRETEERLRLALQSAELGTWDFNPITAELTWDEGCKAVFGLPPDATVEYNTFLAGLHPDDRDRTHQVVLGALNPDSGGEYDIEYRTIGLADGIERWVAAKGKAFFSETKQAIRFIGTVLNITARQRIEAERQQAEADLRQSEERFRNMADNAPVMIWVTDSTAYCTYLSKSWYDFTGQTESTSLGFGWLDAIHPEDYEYARNVFLATNERHEAFQLEYRIRRRDGEYRWAIDTASPWFGLNERFKGYIGSVIDITERKIAEAEREQLLAREQTAREQAETANRIKDEFLAVLSHELRTPLNPILGWSRLLRHSKLDAAKTAYALETIERNAKLQTQLIEDLLDVSRILRGKLSVNMVPVNLALTIKSAVETVQLAAEAKAIQIQTVFDPSVGQILGDAARLQQVVWNLLSNAVKFTPAGGRVNIKLERVELQAQIQVSDTGKGISPDFLPYVFEYFRQADGTTTRTFGGLGLGLAIVRHLVELHGGTVQAESQGEGQGATFTVRLPLMKVDGDTSKDEEPGLLSDSHLLLTGIQVLLVDDEADTRDLVAFILEDAGASVTSVSSAIAALSALVQTKFDLLLSDIGMPQMDGYMLIQQVRTMPQGIAD